MQVPWRCAFRGSGLVVTGLVVLAALAAGAPASAGDGDGDVKGWYVALDAALTQPNSLDQDYANQTDTTVAPPRNRRFLIENDADATFRGTVGYNFGLGLGSLQVSYWSFDNDDSASETLAGFVVPSLFGYGSIGGTYLYSGYGSAVSSESSTKATTADLDYVRPMDAGENVSLRWLAGLRVATFEEDQSFTGSDGVYYAIDQAKHIESDAIGLRVGATAVFDFTKHFSLEGGLTASLLQADSEGNASQSLTDLVGGGSVSETKEGANEHTRGRILDLEVKGVWAAGPVDVYLGYSASSWDGLVQDPVPALGFLGMPEGEKREGISFDSVSVGVRWRFARRGVAAGP